MREENKKNGFAYIYDAMCFVGDEKNRVMKNDTTQVNRQDRKLRRRNLTYETCGRHINKE